MPAPPVPLTRDRAGNGIRTRDINLGKVALYQLSYSRMTCVNIANQRMLCKHFLSWNRFSHSPLQIYIRPPAKSRGVLLTFC